MDSDVELEDRGAQLANDLVELCDVVDEAELHLRVVRHPRRRVQREPRREDPLDHRVVKITPKPLPLGHQRQLLGLLVQPGVVDGDRCGGRERDRQLLVDVREDFAIELVVHVQRDAQEAVHRRMVDREPVAVRVLGEIWQPQRLGRRDQHPEDAAPLRQVADRSSAGVVDPDGDELDQRRLRRIDDAEGRVACTDQFTTGVHDVGQQHRELEIGAQRHHRVEQAAQLSRTGLTA